MQNNIKKFINHVGIARVIIISFFILLCIAAVALRLPVKMIISDVIVRFGMNGILVLSMVPAILCGAGLNFGLPIGVLGGLVAGLLTIEMGLTGWPGILAAIALAIPFGAILGFGYGKFLNKVKGSEMMVGTYAGFSAVALMCIGWLVLPFKSEVLRWPIGQGLRTTITLDAHYAGILNGGNWLEDGTTKYPLDLAFEVGGVMIPTMLLVTVFFFSFLVYLFLKSKTGIKMVAAGSNPRFAKASAIDVDKMRVIGMTLSTALSAVGIIVYAQSFGFYQLYNAPLMMAFGAVGAILIGGASTTSAKIRHVFIGTLLYYGILTVGLPVASALVPEGNLSEVIRVIVTYGIILYALTKASGGEGRA